MDKLKKLADHTDKQLVRQRKINKKTQAVINNKWDELLNNNTILIDHLLLSARVQVEHSKQPTTKQWLADNGLADILRSLRVNGLLWVDFAEKTLNDTRIKQVDIAHQHLEAQLKILGKPMPEYDKQKFIDKLLKDKPVRDYFKNALAAQLIQTEKTIIQQVRKMEREILNGKN